MLRVRRVHAIALIAALLIAACAPGDTPGTGGSAPSPTLAKPVVVGHGAEDVSLDPNLSIATNWQSLLANLYDTLVVRDRSGKLAPSLATSWKAVDATTWEFALRPGVKFHNGETFDAADVKFTVDRVLDAATKSQQRGYIASVTSVVAVDSTTVRISTQDPDPLLIDNLQLVPIVSAKFLGEKGAAALANGANGTGPYRFVEWRKGDRLTMEAFPEHWRGRAKVDRAIFRVIPETATLSAALQAGEIDIAVNLPPDTAGALKGSTTFDIATVPSQRSLYLVLDNTVKPLDDVRVRKALNHAVNVKELTDGLLLGHAQPIPTLLGPMYVGHDASLKPYGHDAAKAKQLLAEAGYPNGFDLTLRAPSGRYVKDKEIAEALAGQLRKVGIKVTLDVQEWGTYLNAYRAHKLGPLYLIGFGTPVWDYTVAFRSYLLASNAQAYYRSPELEEKVKEAGRTVDAEKRRLLLQDINRRIHDEAAFVFLYVQNDIYGVSKRIAWTPGSDEKVWLYDVTPR